NTAIRAGSGGEQRTQSMVGLLSPACAGHVDDQRGSGKACRSRQTYAALLEFLGIKARNTPILDPDQRGCAGRGPKLKNRTPAGTIVAREEHPLPVARFLQTFDVSAGAAAFGLELEERRPGPS